MEKEKLRFGTTEVAAVVVTTVLYVLVEWIQRILINDGILPEGTLDWVRVRVVVASLSAAVFGPLVGVMSGVGGALLTNVIFYGYVSYMEVITYAINGYLLGRHYDKFGVLAGRFKGIAILDYNMVQVLSNVMCSMIIVPLLLFLAENDDLSQAIELGTKNAIGSVMMLAVVGSLILIASSKIIEKIKQ